jgi:hypothetical protein
MSAEGGRKLCMTKMGKVVGGAEEERKLCMAKKGRVR